ncbi:MAG TPA: cellulose-binding protein, partial [Sporichthya sp.]|nr:cellulose-binding protein [Sporichthya sp.]
MRGYDRAAVDAKVAALTDERMAFERRAVELEREMTRMRQSMANGESAPYYITLSRKLEGILRDADEDAQRTKSEAELAGQR